MKRSNSNEVKKKAIDLIQLIGSIASITSIILYFIEKLKN